MSVSMFDAFACRRATGDVCRLRSPPWLDISMATEAKVATAGRTDAPCIWLGSASEVGGRGEAKLMNQVRSFLKYLGFRWSSGGRCDGLKCLEISAPKLRAWALQAGGAEQREQKGLHMSYRGVIAYLWAFYAHSLEAVLVCPSLADSTSSPSRALDDFHHCARILALDAEQQGLDTADCPEVDSVALLVQEQIATALGVAVNAEFMCSCIPALCTHLAPNPLMAYGLLLGRAAGSTVGLAALPC